jgi:hypothetical protein
MTPPETPPASQPTAPSAWYAQTWFTILTLIFLAPLGWFLLWKYRSWSLGVKVGATVLSLALFMSAMSNQAKEDAQRRAAQETTVAVSDSANKATSSDAPTSQASKPTGKPQASIGSAKAKAASTPRDSKTTAKPGPDKPADAPTASNVSVQEIKGVGKREVGTVDQVQYAVLEVERAREIGGTQADGTFIVLRVLAHNTAKETHNINTSIMKLQDNQGREYDPSSKGATALALSGDQTAEVFMAQVQPDTAKQFSLVYDGPESAKGLKLKIPSGAFSLSGEAIIKVP